MRSGDPRGEKKKRKINRQPGPDHARLRGHSTDLKPFLYVMEMPVKILRSGGTESDLFFRMTMLAAQ